MLQRGRIEHHIFRELPQFLRGGDLLVLNETRVIAARVFGRRPTGGRMEVVLLRPAASRISRRLEGRFGRAVWPIATPSGRRSSRM